MTKNSPEALIELAESLKKVLRPDQMKRILEIAKKLDQKQRDKLFTKLKELEKAEIKALWHELDVRKSMQSAFKAYKSKEKIKALHAMEAEDRNNTEATALNLLEELNQA